MKTRKNFSFSRGAADEIEQHDSQTRYLDTLVNLRRAHWTAAYSVITEGANGAEPIHAADLAAILSALSTQPVYSKALTRLAMNEAGLAQFIPHIETSLGVRWMWLVELVAEYDMGNKRLIALLKGGGNV